jgi:hypothetical protein
LEGGEGRKEVVVKDEGLEVGNLKREPRGDGDNLILGE